MSRLPVFQIVRIIQIFNLAGHSIGLDADGANAYIDDNDDKIIRMIVAIIPQFSE